VEQEVVLRCFGVSVGGNHEIRGIREKHDKKTGVVGGMVKVGADGTADGAEGAEGEKWEGKPRNQGKKGNHGIHGIHGKKTIKLEEW
jgi:hypothetical protein